MKQIICKQQYIGIMYATIEKKWSEIDTKKSISFHDKKNIKNNECFQNNLIAPFQKFNL